MSDRWASPVIDAASDYWQVVRQQGTVRLISTAWGEVRRRLPEQAHGIDRDEALKDFDQVPLQADDKVVAVFVRGHGVEPVHSGMFMAADAPLLSFVQTADRQRFRLLLQDGEIVGLVTLSDLQRLPVYSLLFSVCVGVEALLVACIRRRCGEASDAWLDHLDEQDRATVEWHFKRRRAANVAIDRLSCASLRQEIKAAIGLGLVQRNDARHQDLEALAGLRDAVCHVQEFAATPEQALTLPTQVRAAVALANWLQRALSELNP
jgi:hypothetical protein